MLTGELELPAMDRDDRDGKVVLRHLEPVLDGDVARTGGVHGCERPAPSRELDQGKAPERLGARRLVTVVPHSVLALEQGASLVQAEGGDECVRDG